jgi:hypothetical protein
VCFTHDWAIKRSTGKDVDAWFGHLAQVYLSHSLSRPGTGQATPKAADHHPCGQTTSHQLSDLAHSAESSSLGLSMLR